MKNAYGKKYLTDVEKEAYRIIKTAELNCLADIVQLNNKNVLLFFQRNSKFIPK